VPRAVPFKPSITAVYLPIFWQTLRFRTFYHMWNAPWMRSRVAEMRARRCEDGSTKSKFVKFEIGS
jgi:hypothetical protein